MPFVGCATHDWKRSNFCSRQQYFMSIIILLIFSTDKFARFSCFTFVQRAIRTVMIIILPMWRLVIFFPLSLSASVNHYNLKAVQLRKANTPDSPFFTISTVIAGRSIKFAQSRPASIEVETWVCKFIPSCTWEAFVIFCMTNCLILNFNQHRN